MSNDELYNLAISHKESLDDMISKFEELNSI